MLCNSSRMAFSRSLLPAAQNGFGRAVSEYNPPYAFQQGHSFEEQIGGHSGLLNSLLRLRPATAPLWDSSPAWRGLTTSAAPGIVANAVEPKSEGTGPSDTERQLLDASKRLDAAIDGCDAASVRDLLAEVVKLKADGLSLKQDLQGSEDVGAWFQAFWERYDFTSHDSIAGAVDHNSPGIAFSFFQDKGVKRKESDNEPETIVGIFAKTFNDDGKIADISFLRQLTTDEAEKSNKPPPQKLQFDPEQFRESGVAPDAERAELQHEATKAYMDIWRSGDTGDADAILTENVTMYDPVFGTQKKGRQAFKEYISNFREVWKTDDMQTRIAVTPGNKSFVSYTVSGRKEKGVQQGEGTVRGLNMLVFNEDCCITDVIGLRTPL